MSDPEPSVTDRSDAPSTGGRGGAGAIVAGVAAVLLVATLVAWLSLRGGDDPAPTSGDPAPGQSSQPTDPTGTGETATSDAEGTTSPSATDEPSATLPPDVPFTRAAKRAVAAGVPALVPDEFGDRVGSVTAADFTDGLWQLTVTTESGEVVLRQDAGPADALVARYADGLRAKGYANLAGYGLGSWQRHLGPDGFALSTDLPDGGAVATGPDEATVLSVVQTLLTFEATKPNELG